MKTLHLNLIKVFFDQIASGEKKEEYRVLKPYWVSRFADTTNYPAESEGEKKNVPFDIHYDLQKHNCNWAETLKSYYCEQKKFDTVTFKNGYSKNAPTLVVECLGIEVKGQGKREWGWTPAYGRCFVIKLGKIISKTN